MRIGVGVAVRIHVRQQFRHRPRRHVGAQGPRRVRVTQAPRRVGHIFEKMTPEDEPLVRVDLLAVDADPDAAQRLQLDAGRGDDDVGVEVSAGAQRDAGGVHVVDVIGHHVDVARRDGLVEVAVEDEAHPLIPRVVRRREMGVDVVARGQVLLGDAAQQTLAEPGCPPGDQPEQRTEQRHDPARNPVGNPARQDFPDTVDRRLHSRHRHHVGRGSLQHRDVCGLLCQRRDHADRRRTAADRPRARLPV